MDDFCLGISSLSKRITDMLLKRIGEALPDILVVVSSALLVRTRCGCCITSSKTLAPHSGTGRGTLGTTCTYAHLGPRERHLQLNDKISEYDAKSKHAPKTIDGYGTTSAVEVQLQAFVDNLFHL